MASERAQRVAEEIRDKCLRTRDDAVCYEPGIWAEIIDKAIQEATEPLEKVVHSELNCWLGGGTVNDWGLIARLARAVNRWSDNQDGTGTITPREE